MARAAGAPAVALASAAPEERVPLGVSPWGARWMSACTLSEGLVRAPGDLRERRSLALGRDCRARCAQDFNFFQRFGGWQILAVAFS